MRVRYTKWGERPHWEFDAVPLGSDEHGWWLGMARGTRLVRPGADWELDCDAVLLVPEHQPYPAMFMARSAEPHNATPPVLYVDITSVPERADTTVHAVDLDLDVVRLLDGTVFVEDKDEFERHRVAFGYPDDVTAMARQVCARLVDAVHDGTEPFGTASRRWFAELAKVRRQPLEPVVVVSHDPHWGTRFAAEREVLERVLQPWLADGVRHIGSTSVPGLAAKPILDMIAGVRDLGQARAAYGPLAELGYVAGTHRPHEAHWFRRSATGTTLECALHLTEAGSRLWQERLAFRDALRADDALRDEYAALKLQLAAEVDSLRDYTDRKRAFVARVLSAAGISLQVAGEEVGHARAQVDQGGERPHTVPLLRIDDEL
jgi:GrpB-like predicted nucleotidyltransferase (UPF0157 family)